VLWLLSVLTVVILGSNLFDNVLGLTRDKKTSAATTMMMHTHGARREKKDSGGGGGKRKKGRLPPGGSVMMPRSSRQLLGSCFSSPRSSSIPSFY